MGVRGRWLFLEDEGVIVCTYRCDISESTIGQFFSSSARVSIGIHIIRNEEK